MKGHSSQPVSDQSRIPQSADLLTAIAGDQGFQLFKHYSEAQAAKIIGIHPATLKKLRLTGSIPYIRIGKRRVALFGYQIAEYLITQIQPCQLTNNVNSNLETTGLVNGRARPHITEHGSTKKIDGHTASLSAHRTLRKPNKV